MKKRFSEEQIIKAIKQHEAGAKVEEICRQLTKYAGVKPIEFTPKAKGQRTVVVVLYGSQYREDTEI